MIPFLPRVRIFVDAATVADADAMAAIHAEAFPHGWSAFEFASLIAQPTVFALAVRRESPFRPRRLAGFVLVRAVADEAEILTVAVRAASRARGLGRRLMDEALRRLYRDRVLSCFLEVDPDNAPAIALYRRLGFAVVGERKGYYRRSAGAAAPALVMRLQVR